MLTQKRRVGNQGESMARGYLISKGYSIVESNYNTKFGEIDIIAKRNGITHFIEVKSGYSGNIVTPMDNLTRDKIRKLTKTVQIYLNHKKISQEQRWQMDAIVVVFGAGSNHAEITHIENINIL